MRACELWAHTRRKLTAITMEWINDLLSGQYVHTLDKKKDRAQRAADASLLPQRPKVKRSIIHSPFHVPPFHVTPVASTLLGIKMGYTIAFYSST